HDYELGQTQLNSALSDLTLRQSEHQTTEQQLLLRRLQLDSREQDLTALQQQLAARQHDYELGQTQLNAALSDLTLRQSEHQTTEQQLLLRRKQLDSREQNLTALQQQLAAHQHEYELSQTQLNAALSDLVLRQSEHQTAEQELLLRRKQLDSREQELMARQQQLATHQHEYELSQTQHTTTLSDHEGRQRILQLVEQQLSQRQRLLDTRERELADLQRGLITEEQTLASRRRELSSDELRLQSRESSLAELPLLQARLAAAENGLREREKLIREMYARLAGHEYTAAQSAYTSMGMDSQVLPSDVSTDDPGNVGPATQTMNSDGPPVEMATTGMTSNRTAPLPEPEPVSGVVPDAVAEPPSKSMTDSDSDSDSDSDHSAARFMSDETVNSEPVSPAHVPMYLPAGLLSDDLMDLLEPHSPPGSLVTPPSEVNFQSPLPDQPTGPMMYLKDSSEFEPESSDDEDGTELVSALAPAEEAARSYVTQLVSSQSARRTGAAQPPESGRSSDSLYADRIVHQLRHSREKPKPAAPRPTVSYIEQFLTGQRKLWESDAEAGQEAAIAAETVPVQQTMATASLEPRPKVDVPRIREEMESFRKVSSHVANQAVVNHSLRKSRSGLLPRAGLVSIFMVSTILLSRGPMQLGRAFPPVLWCNLALLFLSALELARKMTQVIWMSLTAPRAVRHETRSTVAATASDDSPEQPLF
ncbi:MAG: hypothetical protein ACKO2P_02880, partial [Planctomycetota bacterium]